MADIDRAVLLETAARMQAYRVEGARCNDTPLTCCGTGHYGVAMKFPDGTHIMRWVGFRSAWDAELFSAGFMPPTRPRRDAPPLTQIERMTGIIADPAAQVEDGSWVVLALSPVVKTEQLQAIVGKTTVADVLAGVHLRD